MLTRFGAVAMLTVVLAGPAIAQTTTATPPSSTVTPVGDRDDGFDWGWIGLLGLAGLAPLFMRKDRQGNVHADTRR
ncbi:WGxxGxxG family protein [Belnapia sp. F-4-1]|uniref:WGxxGxxG family protein n=1 Tax=Belnapia sp. F-4-1 TaxID=1545443 RepID=UPI0005BD0481|nr:WGxxGxxG family protein [Belnapia sp. F-4-1]